MSKRSNDRRNASDGRYCQMYEWFQNSVAWQHANVYERSLYLELKRRYDGKNNGDIPFSHREAQAALGCSNKPVAAAFIGLQAKGFIKARVRGSFNWKVAKAGQVHGRSTRWEITELPLDVPIRVLSGGTKDFMKWRPEEKMPVCPEHTNGTPSAHHKKEMVRREHTINGGVYAHGTR